MMLMKLLKRLLSESLLKKLIKNSGILFTGNILAQALGICTLALTTILLDPKQFGVLVIIQTYTIIIDRLVNFQSWQAIIKYGTDALENNNINKFKGYIKFGTILDFCTALLATILAVIGIQCIGPVLNLSDEHILMGSIYSLTILFHLSGTPTAILRMLDKFKLFAFIHVISAFIKLMGVTISYISSGGLWHILYVWMITEIIGHLLLLIISHYVLYKKNIKYWWNSHLDDWRDVFKFTWWSNLSTTLDIPIKQLDMIVVSMVISFEGVAIYRVFKQVSQIIGQVADPIYQTIYPLLVKMISNNNKDKLLNLVIKSGIVLFSVLLPLVFFLSITSPYWLNLFFGDIYAENWGILIVYLFLRLISVSFIGIHPLFIALGFVQKNVSILVFANLIYLIVVLILGNLIGLLGVVLASGIQFSIVIACKIFYIRKNYHLQLS